jgi:hypothetical protein
LTAAEIQRVREDWRRDQENSDNPFVINGTPDRDIERAKIYLGQDYRSMDQQTVDEIVSSFLPTFHQQIREMIVRTGFL